MNRQDSREQAQKPANVLFHRALISLIPAMTLSLVAYEQGFPWYLVMAAACFWVLGIYFLRQGSIKLSQEQPSHDSKRGE
jgi:hypothetical protein